MNALPVIARELRVRARHGTVWLRVVVSATLFAVVLHYLAGSRIAHVNGLELLSMMAWPLHVYALTAGLWSTCEALSRERREGTLGLLMLTELRALDVVLGKLVATSLQAVYVLIGAFPVLALTLVLGGVTFGQFALVTASLIVTLWLSLGIGLFFSAAFHSAQRVQIWSAGSVLMLGLIAPLAGMGFASAGRTTLGETLTQISPSTLLAECLAPTIYYPVLQSALLGFLAAGAVLVLGAGLVLGRTWRRDSFGSAGVRLGSVRLLRPLSGVFRWLEQWQIRRRQPVLEHDPYSWVSGRSLSRQAALLGLLFLGGAVWVVAWVRWPSTMTSIEVCWVVPTVNHLLVKLYIAGHAGFRLADDRRSGALEILLTTGLNATDFFRGEALALARAFWLPVTLVLMVDLAAFSQYVSSITPGSAIGSMLIFHFISTMVFFVADIATLCMVAMWVGFRTGKPLRGTASAVFWVLILPGLFLVFFGVRMGEATFIIWAMLCGTIDAVCYALAYGSLNDRFRELASQPVGWKSARIDGNPLGDALNTTQ